MSKAASSTKAERKAATAAVENTGAYEDTAFGRRRISKAPKALMTLFLLVSIPVLFIYRRLRRPRAA